MSQDYQQLYAQLGNLAASAPKLAVIGRRSDEARTWLSRLRAIISTCGMPGDVKKFDAASDVLARGEAKDRHIVQTVLDNAEIKILDILYNALANAELHAPATDQGSFIRAGSTFTAMTAVGNILKSTKQDVLIVDPYMDGNALTEFVTQAPEKISVRLLADQQYVKPGLKPAVQRWITEFAASRPLEARITPKKLLHDRLIIVDDTTVWVLTQSLNAIAERSHASIVRTGDEAATLKVDAYRDIWKSAAPI